MMKNVYNDYLEFFGFPEFETALLCYNGLVREPGWFPPKSCGFSSCRLQNTHFQAEFVRKLQFPDNSNIKL